jgi:hypothetical protein
MKFKHKKDERLFYSVHFALQLIIIDMNYFANTRFGKSLIITDTISTIEDDKRLGRVSASHVEKRAVDVSVRNLDEHEILQIHNYINSKPEYKKYHYLRSSGSKILAYRHNNSNGDHFHVALHSKFAIR